MLRDRELKGELVPVGNAIARASEASGQKELAVKLLEKI